MFLNSLRPFNLYDLIVFFLFQLSYFYAKLIFPNSVSMQLGVFFTGISPGGGASSVWALLLGGNINLSIVLTTIGTLESFGTC